MLYFAYGSNMLTERLQARVPSARPRTSATLPRHTLQFHKRSQDGSGKCSVTEGSGARAPVHGVLFEIDEADVSKLDEAEDRGHGYERFPITVTTEDRTVQAFAYVAQTAYIDHALQPYNWYRHLVVAGAHQHGLPRAYRQQVAAVSAIPDPNPERRRAHRALLRDAGFDHLWPDA
jgi:gamma-glutamylcyclotransferase (GGCT)/AIG2-like uncharacterized protein YtfP